MAPNTPLSDDFVAEILRQEASRNNDLAASGPNPFLFLPGRPPRSNAPKPNTRFLRNVLRDTDSHNAALKAREEADARARRRKLQRADDYDDAVHHSRRRHRSDRDIHRSRESYRAYESRKGHSSRLSRSRSPETTRHNRAERPRRKRRRYDDEEEDRAVRREARTRSRSRSRSPRERKHRRQRRRTPSPGHHPRAHQHEHSRAQHCKDGQRQQQQQQEEEEEEEEEQRQPKRSSKYHPVSDPDSDSDSSDPLEALVGPLPPPKVLPRGRGAHRTSAIDTRFGADYDPSAEVELEAETLEDDEWGLALEALRDRRKWRKHRAERLRAAGFTDEQVCKFESGESSRSNDEKGASDVRWRKRGEGREWDRGKVVDGDRVDVAPEWGRLKGT